MSHSSCHTIRGYTLSENFILRYTDIVTRPKAVLRIYGDILLAKSISRDILSVYWDKLFPCFHTEFYGSYGSIVELMMYVGHLHLESCTPGTRHIEGSTRWYVLVRASTCLTRYKVVREASKWYIPVRTDIENFYVGTYLYIPVCTALYMLSTMWYKVVKDGKRWYKVVQTTVYGLLWRYMEVQGSTRIV